MSLNRLGDIARCENDYEEAERIYKECYNIYRESGDRDEIPSLLHNLGYSALHQGRYEEALTLFKEGLETHIETENQPGIAECLAGIAAVLLAQGQPLEAARLFGTAEAARERLGMELWPANRLEFERSLDKLGRLSDSTALAAAWETGQATPLGAVCQNLPLDIT
jgi:tetratricopeptide (TPR) repeat protein